LKVTQQRLADWMKLIPAWVTLQNVKKT